MAIDESALERVLLLAEASDFLYREAYLLDERRYDEWLSLLGCGITTGVGRRQSDDHDECESQLSRRDAHRVRLPHVARAREDGVVTSRAGRSAGNPPPSRARRSRRRRDHASR